ncbi:MAG TPA: hypothetical protein VGD67_03220, partial [Pseudonocardiaceae bacterium]
LDAAARRANLAGRVRLRPSGAPPPGTAVWLLDDVTTTGATISAAAAELGANGIRVIGGLVIASAAPLLHPGGLRDDFVTVRRNHRSPRSRVA